MELANKSNNKNNNKLAVVVVVLYMSVLILLVNTIVFPIKTVNILYRGFNKSEVVFCEKP